MVQTVMREVLKTVNGSSSQGADTEQYYLDLKRTSTTTPRSKSAPKPQSDDALTGLLQRHPGADGMQRRSALPGPDLAIPDRMAERRVERMGYLFLARRTIGPRPSLSATSTSTSSSPSTSRVQRQQPGRRGVLPPEVAGRGLQALPVAIRGGTGSGVHRQRRRQGDLSSKAQDSLRSMSKWLQEKQMTAFEVTYQGKTKTLQDWSKGVSLRDRARLGPDERINFRDVVNIVSGLALGQRFSLTSPEYPTFGAGHRGQPQIPTGGQCTARPGRRHPHQGCRSHTDALELLDGDRVDLANPATRRKCSTASRPRGPRPGTQPQRTAVGRLTSSISRRSVPAGARPAGHRAGWSLLPGDIVLSITGDKIDSGKLVQLAERSLEELKQFKHVEAPKEINLAVLRALFELFDLPSGLAQKASQGDTESVIKLQEQSALVPRVLKAGSDLQQGKLGFWGQNLLREEEAKDWHARLDSLKKFTESLAPHNTVGKLKNLRVTQEDLDGQKKNLNPGRRRASARTGGGAGQHGVLPLAGRDGVASRAPVG